MLCSTPPEMTFFTENSVTRMTLQLEPGISKIINSICIFFRIENLELLSQYGGAAWKIHNETLTRILAQQQKKLMDIK